MKGWHYDPRDTKQQRAILRTNEAAQKVRIRFAPGTRVRGRFGPQLLGEVIRHIPETNSQGGQLIVDWSTGQRGRVGPITVEAVLCSCMTEDPADGHGERVVTHSLTCPQHPEHVSATDVCTPPFGDAKP